MNSSLHKHKKKRSGKKKKTECGGHINTTKQKKQTEKEGFNLGGRSQLWDVGSKVRTGNGIEDGGQTATKEKALGSRKKKQVKGKAVTRGGGVNLNNAHRDSYYSAMPRGNQHKMPADSHKTPLSLKREGLKKPGINEGRKPRKTDDASGKKKVIYEVTEHELG